jgi:outer membrane protein assembly factor BamB
VTEPGADAGTVIAYNTATGTALWHASYNPGGLSSSTFVAATVSSDSATVFAAGSTQQTVTKPISSVVVAYDTTTGLPRWTNARYQGPVTGSFTLPEDLAASPDGARVHGTGDSMAPGGQNQFTTVAYDAATGAVAWVGR